MSDVHIPISQVTRVSKGLSGAKPKLWRSLEELSSAEDVKSWLHREFPENASEFTDPEGRRQFPVARHPAPEPVGLDLLSRAAQAERCADVSCRQWQDVEDLARPTVEGRGGGQRDAMHHLLARPSQGQGQPRAR